MIAAALLTPADLLSRLGEVLRELLSLPPQPPAAPPPLLDELIHFALFALLAPFVAQWFRERRADRPSPQRAALGAWLAATAYGGILELAQEAVPGRTGSVSDTLADAFGASFSLGFWLLAIVRKSRRESHDRATEAP